MSDVVLRTVLVGIGATMAMDLWALILKYVYGVSGLDYRMLGRWLGHLPGGRFRHEAIGRAPPVSSEAALGWAAHYAIGIVFAALLVLAVGEGWLEAPTAMPALVAGAVTVLAPFLVLQPALGLGIAAARTPSPNTARLRSLITHLVFGAGLYAAARLTASF